MPSPAQAVLLSWSIPPAATFALAITTLIYVRGWLLLGRAGVPFVPLWRAVSFVLGMLSLWVALASPLDTFSSFLITAHMGQHMVLMMIAPPLILLGAPLIPLVRGLPIFAAREFAGPFLNWRVAIRVGNALIHPAVALILMGLAMFAWHTPRLYELALSSGSWHEFEHVCFFAASLIFWWPVIQPWPSHSHRPRWIVVPYLLIGDLQNTIVSAILVFSERVLYPSYAAMPRLFGFPALADQVASGAIMWVMGSTVFLIPATVIAVQCMSRRSDREIAVRKSEATAFTFVRSFERGLALPSRPLSRWFAPAKIEAMTFVVLFAAAGLCLAALASGASDDDDQALRLSRAAGPFVVSVFSLPGELDPGEAEVGVMVQERDTLQPLLDTEVELRATQPVGETVGPVRATADDAENKLVQSAGLELPSQGDWALELDVRRNGESASVELPLRVAEATPAVNLHGPYLVFAGFAGILMFAYWRRHRGTTRAAACAKETHVAQT
jgi:putative membrane protein